MPVSHPAGTMTTGPPAPARTSRSLVPSRETAIGSSTGTPFKTTSRWSSGGRADGSWPQRLHRYLSPASLILEDFALRKYTMAQAEDLNELVSPATGVGRLCSRRTAVPTVGIHVQHIIS